MIEFRRSLPAYKEKDLLLKAISENQVIVICSFLYLTSDCSPYLYEVVTPARTLIFTSISAFLHNSKLLSLDQDATCLIFQ